MPTLLICWELGAGLGHVTRLAPIAAALAARGHAVVAAVRDLTAAASVFPPAVRLLAAPHRARAAPTVHRPTRSYADILAGLTFADDATCAAHAAAWRNLFDLVRPAAICFDHAPTALLAARVCPAARQIVISTGFGIPPALADPLPPLRAGVDPADLRALEAPLVARANRVLAAWAAPPLARLGDLWGAADLTILTTFAPLDPYPLPGRPPGTRYWGSLLAGHTAARGAEPVWPDASDTIAAAAPRVFAYLKPFAAIDALFAELARRRLPTLAYVPDPAVRARLAQRHAAAPLRLADRPVDLPAAIAQCNLAILNGTHAAACAALLAARPALHVPLNLEQGLTARAVRQLGAGADAPPRDPAKLLDRLSALLDPAALAKAKARAADFAPPRAALDPRRQLDVMTHQLDELLHHEREARPVAAVPKGPAAAQSNSCP